MASVYKQAVDHYVCDCCGKEFYERQDCSLVFRAGEDIAFEWVTSGDYCRECLVLLANGICNSIPVAERCESDKVKIPKELATIEAERMGKEARQHQTRNEEERGDGSL